MFLSAFKFFLYPAIEFPLLFIKNFPNLFPVLILSQFLSPMFHVCIGLPPPVSPFIFCRSLPPAAMFAASISRLLFSPLFGFSVLLQTSRFGSAKHLRSLFKFLLFPFFFSLSLFCFRCRKVSSSGRASGCSMQKGTDEGL